MAREEQKTQQPTGGKGGGFHRKKQKISKGELPKQRGASGIIVHEKVKTMDEVGPSIASKKRKRGCPSSGLSEHDREKRQNEDRQRYRKKMKMPIDDDFLELDDLMSNNVKVPIDDDFLELDDLTNKKFGSFFDGQASVLGRKEAAINERPVQYKEIGSLGSKSHTIFNT